MEKRISFTLNGEERCLWVETNDVLLDTLRYTLGIKSPKCGCDRGDCGACAVLLNGRSVRSCLVLTVEVDGQEVTTIEGLSKEKLTPLQERFHKYNSFQCGFCASGMMISATELLRKSPNPTKEEVKEALSGNLCRCTGYTSIIDAVLDTDKKERP